MHRHGNGIAEGCRTGTEADLIVRCTRYCARLGRLVGQSLLAVSMLINCSKIICIAPRSRLYLLKTCCLIPNDGRPHLQLQYSTDYEFLGVRFVPANGVFPSWLQRYIFTTHMQENGIN